VLVIRGDDGRVRAFHNVCRHRGSQICRTDMGHVRALVCPYHSWTYSRQGDLVACHGMHEGVDKSLLGLKPLHAEICAGLVYVSLAATPPPFDRFRSRFEVAGAPQGFDRARIAHVVDYEVEANWKLVWENNRECYHCTPRHPQYVKSNFDVYEEEHASPAVREQIAAAIARIEAKWEVPGDGVAHPKGGLATFPDPDNGIWYTCNRTALAEGFVTESLDGTRVAPLMGDYRDAEVGVLRMRSLPNFWLHASCDHAVVTRMLPDGPGRRECGPGGSSTATRAQARTTTSTGSFRSGTRPTSRTGRSAAGSRRGIESIGYEPGPLSQRKEYNVDAFIRWYLYEMRSGAS
jgi:Rieske 2Fe-2S family protein